MPNRTKVAVPVGVVLVAATTALATHDTIGVGETKPEREWRVYGGDLASRRYSPLDQINRDNVHRLEVAWVYHTGDHRADNRSQIQCNPIVVDGVLYATSPAVKVVALRADTGEELWTFDPFDGEQAEDPTNRGVVYWEEGGDRRILFTAGSRLFALNAATGRPIPTFGRGGWVDLREGLGRDVSGQYVGATTPGVVYKDLLIQGTRVSEGELAAPGHVRAYDVRSGKIRWVFHTIPHPGEFGYETWPPDAWKTAGGVNSWAGMSLDVDRGIAYVPTGSPSPDFYGGGRQGQNLFGNSVLALDAATGKRIWHFQTVHHDIWDRDLPAPPTLVSVTRDGRRVDAVAQITKSGFVFLLDRATGAPLFPVVERPVPPSDLTGERAWPTQPFPTKPAPFARQWLSEADLTDLTPEARAHALERFRTLRSAGPFVPPSVQGTIVFPGFDGGGEWGGAAFDPATGVLYVNANEMAWIAAMVEKESPGAHAAGSGADVYAANCAACHGADRRGNERSPSLVGVGQRLSRAELWRVIMRGKGFMPSFADLPSEHREALIGYLLGRTGADASAAVQRTDASLRDTSAGASAAPYRFAGYHRFLDPDGYPAIKPPWGTLNAIDLDTGDIVWTIPLGELPELSARGVPPTGTENYGGPVVTAGGLLFIGATKDEKLRAFDKATGKVLWAASLPAGGYATPSTYEVNGRQFVVIAAGGGRGTRSGDAYVAFALPR